MVKISDKIRRYSAPITTSCNITALSGEGYTPLTQTFNKETNSFNPSRTEKPTVIVPKISLTASDGSINIENANNVVGNIKWMIQGAGDTAPTDITAYAALSGKYQIITDGTYPKGSLKLTADLASAETYTLYFTAIYTDTRVSQNIGMTSNRVTLCTSVNAESNYKIALDCETNICYDCLLDRLPIYDYKEANGLLEDGETRESYISPQSYERTIEVTLMKGDKQVSTANYSLKVYHVDETGNTEVTTSDADIISINNNIIKLDLRFNYRQVYKIACVVDGEEVAEIGVTATWKDVAIDNPRIRTAKLIERSLAKQSASVSASYNGNDIEYLDAYCDINWTTDTNAQKNVGQGGGSFVMLDIVKTGLSDSPTDSLIPVVDIELRGIKQILTDEKGDTLTDENGEKLYE